MRHSSQTLRRSAAILCASGLAMSGLLFSAPTAFGADTDYGASNINPDTATSLTIHKYANAKDKTCPGNSATRTGTEADASKVDPTNCVTLDGVTFTAYPVLYNGKTIDLAANGGWDVVKTMNDAGEESFIDDNGFDFKAGSGFTIDTDNGVAIGPTNSGTATAANLGKTLYFVKETAAPPTVTTKTPSFFVTMPLSQTNGGWLYAVHVYPKNAIDSSRVPKKEVGGNASEIFFPTTGGPTAAVKLPYTITVPLSNQDKGFQSGKVEDQLAAYLGVSGTGDVTASYAGAALKSDEYTVTLSPEPSGNPLMAYGTKITVELTAKGLETIGKGGKNFTVDINTTVKPDSATKVIENHFTKEFIPKGGSTDPDPGPDPKNEPVTNKGLATIKKFDASKGNAYTPEGALSGVKFKVYPAGSGDNDAARCADDSKGQVYTTQSDGTVNVDVTVYNGPKEKEVTSGEFCFKETETVAGFDLPANPVQVVTLNGERRAVEISNSKSTGTAIVTLPLTGAAGQLLLTVAGVALIGGGALWLVAARRRRNEDA